MKFRLFAFVRPAILAAGLAALVSGGARAGQTGQTGTAALCLRAARTAASATGVPLRILQAISLAETGRTVGKARVPWPWAINLAGKSYWFGNRAEAMDFARKQRGDGRRNFDIGCFQLNYRWHGNGFDSLAAMFDPTTNALYAARFLDRLHDEFGDWTRAVGAYHSRTPAYARRYAANVARLKARLNSRPLELAAAEGPRRAGVAKANTFPLLQGTGPGVLGSLVPLQATAGAAPLIADIDQQG